MALASAGTSVFSPSLFVVLRLLALTIPLSEIAEAQFRHWLVLLAVRVRTGLGLALHARERRGDDAAFLLVLVLLRLLLFPVASHLAFRHGVLRVRWMGWIRLCVLHTNPSARLCANGTRSQWPKDGGARFSRRFNRAEISCLILSFV